jgi:hypothetical protein
VTAVHTRASRAPADRSGFFGEPQEGLPAHDQARRDLGRAPVVDALGHPVAQRPMPVPQRLLEIVDAESKPAQISGHGRGEDPAGGVGLDG